MMILKTLRYGTAAWERWLAGLPRASAPRPQIERAVAAMLRAVRREGDAIVRVLVGDGSPVELGTPGLILDVELPRGGSFSAPRPLRLQRLRGRVGRRSQSRRRGTSGEPLADRRPRNGSCFDGGRCAAWNALPAHGWQAVRRDARLQRTVRGLTTLL